MSDFRCAVEGCPKTFPGNYSPIVMSHHLRRKHPGYRILPDLQKQLSLASCPVCGEYFSQGPRGTSSKGLLSSHMLKHKKEELARQAAGSSQSTATLCSGVGHKRPRRLRSGNRNGSRDGNDAQLVVEAKVPVASVESVVTFSALPQLRAPSRSALVPWAH